MTEMHVYNMTYVYYVIFNWSIKNELIFFLSRSNKKMFIYEIHSYFPKLSFRVFTHFIIIIMKKSALIKIGIDNNF